MNCGKCEFFLLNEQQDTESLEIGTCQVKMPGCVNPAKLYVICTISEMNCAFYKKRPSSTNSIKKDKVCL
jgi:hypothetical protein